MDVSIEELHRHWAARLLLQASAGRAAKEITKQIVINTFV
jgi:hypothetical protein